MIGYNKKLIFSDSEAVTIYKILNGEEVDLDEKEKIKNSIFWFIKIYL